MSVVLQRPEQAAQGGRPVESSRRNAVAAGVLFIVATVASLLTGPLLAPVKDSDLAAAAGHQGQVAAGVLLGFIAALAAPGIAIALYPVLRRFGEGLALGAVGFRIIEGVFYALNMTVLLSLWTLSREFVDAGAPSDQHYRTLGRALRAQYEWIGDTGMLFAFTVGALMYYVVFFRSGLIPRWLSAWGIAGAVLLMGAAVLVTFGLIAPMSGVQVALAAPIGVQEMVLAVWLIVRGFNPAVLAGRTG